jgi:septal ring-binding cell division protein DamX
MKKIITLSLLSSLVGCAQLLPPKTPLQVPIETINTMKSTAKFVEPTVVAELDASVKTDPLYQSIDSIAVSEQVIENQPVTKIEPVEDVTSIEPSVIAADSTITDVMTEPTIVQVANDTTIDEPVIVTDKAAVTTVATDVTQPATVTESAIVTDSTAATEPTVDAIKTVEPEVIEPVNDTVVEDQTRVDDPIVDDKYQTVDMHGYSVQITASRDEQSLVTLLLLLDSQQPAWLNKKMINGSQVYTLLLGHYSDHEQAKAALALLPEALQQSGAFVRNFYDIEHTGSPQLKQLQ